MADDLYLICAKCAWDKDDPNTPELCKDGKPHEWEYTAWERLKTPEV